MNSNDLIGMGSSFVFLLIIIPVVGGLMYARRERLLTHAERMKALELGKALPDDATTARIKAAVGQGTADAEGSTGSLARKCFSTAVWVALWGFAAAAGLGGAAVSSGVAYAIAAATGAIGVTAVICGTILAVQVAPVAEDAMECAKRRTDDADAFDVVSCRG
jgi:hypothetical protein